MAVVRVVDELVKEEKEEENMSCQSVKHSSLALHACVLYVEETLLRGAKDNSRCTQVGEKGKERWSFIGEDDNNVMWRIEFV